MSEPKFDRKDPDAESMFDFLAEESTAKQRRQKRNAEASERLLPIIRKPVPVSESGPLLPPKAGAPVEPPPALTGGKPDAEDDLDFLNDIPDRFPDRQPVRSRSGAVKQEEDSNITRLDSRSGRSRGENNRTANQKSNSVRGAAHTRQDAFAEIDLSDAPEFNGGRKGSRTVADYDYDDDGSVPRRGHWVLLALVMIAAGAGSFLIANPDELRALAQKFGIDTSSRTITEIFTADDSADIRPAVDDRVVATVSPLMQRFRDKLIQIEGLVADGALDDAEQALTKMDKTVYGYGAAEFGDLEVRIEQLRSGVTETDSAAEQVERDEAARIAQEQAEREAAQVARVEETRIAEAAQAESARLAAAEQSSRDEQIKEEQAKAAAQQAAREEQAKVDAEKSRQARLEQDRQKEQARLSEQAARAANRSSVDSDRQATDRRIAEERAAVQRQQAREQRLIEAREREAAQSSSQKSGDESNSTSSPNTSGASRTVTSGSRPIGDDDLQIVYRRFIDLQQAVSSRDISAVVSLTQRSGVRVQQFMQIFENSTQIDARIRNVSTSNATGQIKGTLQINRIKRSNGTFVEPPAALSSIPLSSQREGDGWSAISW